MKLAVIVFHEWIYSFFLLHIVCLSLLISKIQEISSWAKVPCLHGTLVIVDQKYVPENSEIHA